jgi:hypothetical protein
VGVDATVREERRTALLDLLERRVSLRAALGGLSQFPWDCDEELVELERKHVVEVLGEWRGGVLADADLEVWAETLTGRDDVQVDDDELRQALVELSTPEMFGGMRLTAQTWLARLDA